MTCCAAVGGTVVCLLQQVGTDFISLVPDTLPVVDIFSCLS